MWPCTLYSFFHHSYPLIYLWQKLKLYNSNDKAWVSNYVSYFHQDVTIYYHTNPWAGLAYATTLKHALRVLPNRIIMNCSVGWITPSNNSNAAVFRGVGNETKWSGVFHIIHICILYVIPKPFSTLLNQHLYSRCRCMFHTKKIYLVIKENSVVQWKKNKIAIFLYNTALELCSWFVLSHVVVSYRYPSRYLSRHYSNGLSTTEEYGSINNANQRSRIA